MTVQIAFRISDELAESVDRLCASESIDSNRSEFLRAAVTAYVVEKQRELFDAQIVAGYTRIPNSTEDEWGDLGRQQDTILGVVGRGLDAEDGGW